MCLKFIPQMPASIVGTVMIAAQAVIFRMSVFCRRLDLRDMRLEDRREQGVHRLDLLVDSRDVVGDVAPERPSLVGELHRRVVLHAFDGKAKRRHRALELEHLALEVVDHR